MQGCPTCHCNMIVSSTDVPGFIHGYPERYVGHGLGGHNCRGSDLVQSVAITFSKANNEAGLSHFLFQYSFCLWLLGYSDVFFALPRIPKLWRERTVQHQPLYISTLSPDQSTRLCRSAARPAKFIGRRPEPHGLSLLWSPLRRSKYCQQRFQSIFPISSLLQFHSAQQKQNQHATSPTCDTEVS